jgi:putative transposase
MSSLPAKNGQIRASVMECGDCSPPSIWVSNAPAPSKLKPWPHAPTHHLSEAGTYFVSAGTYLRQHFFSGAERLAVLERGVLKVLAEAGWQLEAWAVFSNHYHFVAHSPSTSAETLSAILKELHRKSAMWVNRLDEKPSRTVWHNFWETRLTFQPSYLARLNYVHQNAVHHGLVGVANHYPFCSAGWFERIGSPAMVKSIYRFDPKRVSVRDEYEPAPDWK